MATPVPSRLPVPMVVVPSLKVTFPVGTPVPGATAWTVAVNMTDCPNRDGLTVEVTEIVVLALLTFWVKPGDVTALNSPSPEYSAVTLCPPTDKVEIGSLVAVPPASVTGDPRPFPSTLNCTVPVGVPDPGATALTVTLKVIA